MKELTEKILLWGLAALFLYGLFASGRFIYRNYRDQKERSRSLSRFLVSLPQRGLQKLLLTSPEQDEVQHILDRYYVLRSTTFPILELKATSSFLSSGSQFPLYFLITYEKIDSFGAPIGAGRRCQSSEFQGTVVAVRMPLASSGRFMISRQPAPDQNDSWDWLSDPPLLGASTARIEEGLIPDFNREFIVNSTNKNGAISRSFQELLLKGKGFFVNSIDRRSALVIDEHGWAFVSDIISDEETLSRLMDFQEGLTRFFKESGKE